MNLSTPPKHRYSRLILLILSGFAAGVCVILLYPSVHPLGGLRLDSSEKDVRQSTHRILSALGLDSVRHDLRIGLVSDADLLKRTYTRHGISGGNRELRRHIPAHAWNVQVLKREGESSAIHFGSQPDEQEIRRMIHGDIGMRFDMDEKLLQYAMPVTDSLVLPSLSPQEAYEHMRRILLGHTRPAILGPLAAVAELPDSLQGAFSFRGIRYAGTEKPERKDHVFSWTVCDAALADSVDVAVTVAGNLPVSLTSTYRSMASGDGDEDTSLAEIFEVVLYIALGILLAVAGFRRMRAYEIGFRSAMVISTLGGILFGIWIMMQVSHQMDNMAMLLLVLLASTTFVWAGFVVLWAVSESVGRETWKEKFISFDLLTSGHLLHARLGMSLLTGLVAGAVLLLVALCASWLIGTWHPVWLLERSSDGMSYLTAPSPALFLLGESVIANLAGAAFFIIFFVSFLRPYIRQPLLLALAAAVPLTLIDIPNLVPLPEAWGVLLPVLFLLVLLFILSDVITTLTAMITLSVLQEGMVFLLPGNSAYYSDGILLLAGAGALILYGIATLATKDRVVDFERIAPRFQRHISERQRLSRELEIARDVQMSFLPKKEPVVEGLDIASHCVPAHEVGGDYYDFMELSPGKLGVVIGDVSGKGTQAAFYMTLTKGFLKALGSLSESPSEVLRRMNRLFYENVERGHFISMIYAVFDMNARQLTVARAGHSPVMRRRADAGVESVRSRGMALGFDEGATFSRTIEETTLPLENGDVFLFYTDGYPEAMTKKREEFGEQRLAEALQRCTDEGAQDILSHLHREIRCFTGRAEQHDDMTMVVVRVT